MESDLVDSGEVVEEGCTRVEQQRRAVAAAGRCARASRERAARRSAAAAVAAGARARRAPWEVDEHEMVDEDAARYGAFQLRGASAANLALAAAGAAGDNGDESDHDIAQRGEPGLVWQPVPSSRARAAALACDYPVERVVARSQSRQRRGRGERLHRGLASARISNANSTVNSEFMCGDNTGFVTPHVISSVGTPRCPSPPEPVRKRIKNRAPQIQQAAQDFGTSMAIDTAEIPWSGAPRSSAAAPDDVESDGFTARQLSYRNEYGARSGRESFDDVILVDNANAQVDKDHNHFQRHQRHEPTRTALSQVHESSAGATASGASASANQAKRKNDGSFLNRFLPDASSDDASGGRMSSGLASGALSDNAGSSSKKGKSMFSSMLPGGGGGMSASGGAGGSTFGYLRVPASSRYRSDFDELGILGKGHKAVVLKVRNRVDGCTYAVKRLRKPLHTRSERLSALREVHALSSLSFHPCVVRYFSSWFEDSDTLLFIQFEYCHGTVMLGSEYAPGSVPALLALFVAIASALAHLHRHGLVHLDVKPDNILLGLDNQYRLADFELCCKADGSDYSGGEGDSRYLAAELLDDSWRADLRPVDIFALGTTVIELVLQEAVSAHGPRWHAIRSPDKSMMYTQLLSKLGSSELAELIVQCTEVEPNARPTAEQIVARLQQLCPAEATVGTLARAANEHVLNPLNR
ncbi:Wee1-like protein kinase [Porphyridium purpureum]|uniref:Wee1-like protein kinase n=1 Tax=Porphyridium purpureum TaxID=35688 RepID=A0A5J4YJB0_PORPP|nr:Wee1-like protein kinase [Porphyridium purpureum]|eukprot:POR8028..scf291_13